MTPAAIANAYRLQGMPEEDIPDAVRREREMKMEDASIGGWIGWLGGPMPVAENALVDVCFRSGRIGLGRRADEWFWGEMLAGSSGLGAIVAYRLHRPITALSRAEGDAS